MQHIEICVQTHNQEDIYYKCHSSNMFFTNKSYHHDELVSIMKNIKQKYIIDDDWGIKEIDFRDLCKQLAEFEIYELLSFERYYFDLEEE